MNIVIPYEEILKLVVSVIVGGLVGIERETYHKPAGVRTHMLVCFGATLFTVVTVMSFPQETAGRIAAGIVTGVGFLGAGTIFKSRDSVKGLTTAASLWAVAAIGLTIGLGYYEITAFAAIIVLLVLQFDKLLKK